MTEIIANGTTYDIPNDLTGETGYGYAELIEAGTGDTLPRVVALMVDLAADAQKGRSTTSATSKNGGLSGSQTWVLASDISPSPGQPVVVARTSDPSGVNYYGTVTDYVAGTKTVTVAVSASTGGSGPYTDWTVTLVGQQGPAGTTLPVADSTALVKGSADATKLLRAEVDTLTTATTRVWTAQDKDGYVALTGGRPDALDNVSLAASVAANALTISLKHASGNDPAAGRPVDVAFRNPTAATGTFSNVAATAALSLTVSSGSTLGASNSTPFRLWVVLFNDAGTLRLGVVNCLSGGSVMPLRDHILASSTAEGGAGAADSAQVIYTGTAVAAKAMRVLGFMEWSSGLATAGTWASGPTKIQLFGPGVPLPGEVIQTQRTATGAVATGTTTIPFDDTIPQNTEGTQFMTQAITPTAVANLLVVEAQAHLANSSTSAKNAAIALFQDSTANALAATAVSQGASQAGYVEPVALRHALPSAATSSTDFKIRGGFEQAGTTTFNGSGGSRIFGGVFNSFLQVQEVMA